MFIHMLFYIGSIKKFKKFPELRSFFLEPEPESELFFGARAGTIFPEPEPNFFSGAGAGAGVSGPPLQMTKKMMI